MQPCKMAFSLNRNASVIKLYPQNISYIAEVTFTSHLDL
jgi:hypothetical protein